MGCKGLNMCFGLFFEVDCQSVICICAKGENSWLCLKCVWNTLCSQMSLFCTVLVCFWNCIRGLELRQSPGAIHQPSTHWKSLNLQPFAPSAPGGRPGATWPCHPLQLQVFSLVSRPAPPIGCPGVTRLHCFFFHHLLSYVSFFSVLHAFFCFSFVFPHSVVLC